MLAGGRLGLGGTRAEMGCLAHPVLRNSAEIVTALLLAGVGRASERPVRVRRTATSALYSRVWSSHGRHRWLRRLDLLLLLPRPLWSFLSPRLTLSLLDELSSEFRRALLGAHWLLSRIAGDFEVRAALVLPVPIPRM